MPHIIGEGDKTDRDTLGLDSRKRHHIRNLPKLDRDPTAMRDIARITEETFGVRCLSTSSVYNCAGLVFGGRRTWVEVEITRWILEEDGYRALPDPHDWGTGDVVVYLNDHGVVVHVALVHSVAFDFMLADPRVTVVSAWGPNGEYVHDWRSVNPMLGRPVEVWSQRRL